MTTRLSEPDYQLTWPRETFVAEVAALLNDRQRRDWEERCALLLDDAFVRGYAGGPIAEFRELQVPQYGQPPVDRQGFTAQQAFLRSLMDNAHRLYEEGDAPRRPYYRERRGGPKTEVLLEAREATQEFIALIHQLEQRGYFEKRLGKDCVDDSSGDHPAELIRHELGEPDLWPLPQDRLVADQALFFDVIELLHDFAARPRDRSLHDFSGCGWHHRDFDIPSGRKIYRWRVNKLLARTTIPLRLADEGEDVGRLVARTDDGRTELVQRATARAATVNPTHAAEQVAHAIGLFRARGADRNQKRSAIAALGLVLEERRHGVLTGTLAKSDRGALFDIANNFHIRHQDAKQRRDYDDHYLDWIFWLYLATIELTDQVLQEQRAADTAK